MKAYLFLIFFSSSIKRNNIIFASTKTKHIIFVVIKNKFKATQSSNREKIV